MSTPESVSLLNKIQPLAQILRDLGPTARVEAVAAAFGRSVTVVSRAGQVLADVAVAEPELVRATPAKGRRARQAAQARGVAGGGHADGAADSGGGRTRWGSWWSAGRRRS